MVQKVTKRLRIDFSKLKRVKPGERKDVKQEIKRQVGEYLVDAINQKLDQSRSPVTGGRLRSYKDKKYRSKHGSPDLLLTGDMRSQITYQEFRDGIEVGVFDSEEAQKADNHNKNSAKSRQTGVRQRQFIPYNTKGRRGSFHTDIRQEVNKIVERIIDNASDSDEES